MKNKAGYTLLEILVVLVIIGITASIALLTVGHNHHKRLENFTQELAQTISLAQEQAMLQPATLGLIFTNNGFGFYEYQRAENSVSWKPLTDHELGRHELPAEVQVSFKNADQIQLPTDSKPVLVISTNGDLTPFMLFIGHKDEKPRFVIIGSKDGTVTSQPYPG